MNVMWTKQTAASAMQDTLVRLSITWSQRVDESSQRLSIFPVGREVFDATIFDVLVDPQKQLLFRRQFGRLLPLVLILVVIRIRSR